jgi:ACS family hexuronate transporter-like MFS transporter
MAPGLSLHRRDRRRVACDVVFRQRQAAVRDYAGLSRRSAEGAKADGLRFNDARLWSFILAYGLGATPLGFVMYAAALYLNQALGKDQLFLGKVLWIPPLGWELGYFFWGWLVDRMTSAGVSTITTVRRLMFVSVFLSLPLAAVPWMSSTALVLLAMFFATFVIVGFVVPFTEVRHTRLLDVPLRASSPASAPAPTARSWP